MTPPRMKNRTLATGIATSGALALSIAVAGGAHAHVSIDADTAEAGSEAVLTFAIPHGCDDSATTAVSVQIPDEITSVTAIRHPLYSTEVREQEEEPAETADGQEQPLGSSEVVYTADTPLPADERDDLQLAVQIPADAEGQTLFFPTIQTCDGDEVAWIEIPADGQDPHELEEPAPDLSIVAAGADDAPSSEADELPGQAQRTDDEPTAWQVSSLALGALGLTIATVALLRGRSRT